MDFPKWYCSVTDSDKRKWFSFWEYLKVNRTVYSAKTTMAIFVSPLSQAREGTRLGYRVVS
jgi:hypothetical protein